MPSEPPDAGRGRRTTKGGMRRRRWPAPHGRGVPARSVCRSPRQRAPRRRQAARIAMRGAASSAPSARAQLPAAAVDVLAGRVAQLGEHAAPVQRARDRRGALPRRAAERQAVDRCCRGSCSAPRTCRASRRDDAFELVVAVVDAVEQRPLVLDRVAGRARVALAGVDQLGRRRCAARAAAARARSSGLVVCSDSASAGFTAPRGRRSNTRGSPTVENTRFLWPMSPSVPSSSIASSTLSRLWAGSPMPMKTTFFTGAPARAPAPPGRRSRRCRAGGSGRRGRSCRTRQPTAQPTWRRDAQAVARQQHALDGLAVGQVDQQALGAVVAGMLRSAGAPGRRSSASSAGRAARSAGGRKSSGAGAPLSCGSACDHRRSTRCSWRGRAPSARRRWRIGSRRIRKGAGGDGGVLARGRPPLCAAREPRLSRAAAARRRAMARSRLRAAARGRRQRRRERPTGRGLTRTRGPRRRPCVRPP